jgi:hypothetical protein
MVDVLSIYFRDVAGASMNQREIKRRAALIVSGLIQSALIHS